jgi:hypothetical protein
MTKIKPTTTLVFASIAMIWWTTHLAMFFHCYQYSDEPPSPPPQEHRHGCAINLYGLPRSCKDAVLPSLITNVIQINRHYYCDYYVHYFNKTFEPGGRSGLGGEIHPEDVLLLEPAVTAVHGHKNRSSPTNHILCQEFNLWQTLTRTLSESERKTYEPFFSIRILTKITIRESLLSPERHCKES